MMHRAQTRIFAVALVHFLAVKRKLQAVHIRLSLAIGIDARLCCRVYDLARIHFEARSPIAYK